MVVSGDCWQKGTGTFCPTFFLPPVLLPLLLLPPPVHLALVGLEVEIGSFRKGPEETSLSPKHSFSLRRRFFSFSPKSPVTKERESYN